MVSDQYWGGHWWGGGVMSRGKRPDPPDRRMAAQVSVFIEMTVCAPIHLKVLVQGKIRLSLSLSAFSEL